MAKKSRANYVPNKNIKSITKPTRKYSTYEKKVFVINNLKEFKQLLDLRANQKTFTPEPTNYPATYIIENGKLVHKAEFGKMKYEDGGSRRYAKGGMSRGWVNYDKSHLMNTETGMIVSKGTDLKNIKPKDIKGFEKLGVGKYEDGGNFEEFLNENEENDNWYDNNWFYGQYKDNKFTFQVENERGDFILEPMEATIYDMISRINKLKDGERAVFSNHESIERKQGNFIYHYNDGGGKRKIVESKIKDIVIDGIRSDVRDYYQQMPIGSMYANGGGIKSWQSKPLSYKINLFKAMGYSNSAAKELASESLKSLKNEDEYGDLYYEIVEHLKSNKYAKGGGLRGYKYVPKYNIENVELTKGNKTVEVDGADLINGLYIKKGKYSKGGGVGKDKLKEFEIFKNGTQQGTVMAKNLKEAKDKVFAAYGEHREVYEVDTYAKGGGLSSKQDKANKKLEKHIEYEFVNTDMGSGWAFSLDGFDLEMTYLDIFDADGIDDYDSLSKEDKKYYYEDWKDSLFESSYEQFKNLAFKKYGNYYMENGGNMNDDSPYICTYEIGGL